MGRVPEQCSHNFPCLGAHEYYTVHQNTGLLRACYRRPWGSTARRCFVTREKAIQYPKVSQVTETPLAVKSSSMYGRTVLENSKGTIAYMDLSVRWQKSTVLQMSLPRVSGTLPRKVSFDLIPPAASRAPTGINTFSKPECAPEKAAMVTK